MKMITFLLKRHTQSNIKNDDGFYGQIRPSSLFPDTLRLHSNDKNGPKYYDLEFDFLSKTPRIK